MNFESDHQIEIFINEQYNINNLEFVGEYIEKKGFTRFINVKDENFLTKEFLGNNEVNENFKGKPLWVHVPHPVNGLKNGYYYKFKAKLSSENIRKKHKNPFALQLDNSKKPILFSQDKREFIENRYNLNKQITHLDGALSKALEAIQKEINKSPETFIFELLQNANDNPSHENKVDVTFKLKDNHLLLSHSGSPFTYSNVNALCSISDSDKKKSKNKIGFKGIGFKSIFKDCDFAFINSGGFSFSFDKNHFYTEKPFQIIPIWTDQDIIPASIIQSIPYKNARVSIILKPRNSEKIDEYEFILNNLFDRNEILLFLPNVESIRILDQSDDYKIIEKNLINYWTGNFKIKVNEKQSIWLKKQIEFGESEVPDKYLDIEYATIQFATKRERDKIVPFENGLIFNYLPTKENIGLKFLINGDFIPDGSRDYLHNIQWNEYLMYEAGKKFLIWLKNISSKKDNLNDSDFKFTDSYLHLLPDFKDIKSQVLNERSKNLLDYFIEGVKESVVQEKIDFIRTFENGLTSLSDAVLDETGVLSKFNYLKTLDFKYNSIVRVNSKKSKSLLRKAINYFEKGEIFTVENLKSKIFTEHFQLWLKIPENNLKFINHLNSKDILKELLKQPIILTSKINLKKASEIFDKPHKNILDFNPEKIHDEVYSKLNDEIEINFKKYKYSEWYKNNVKGDPIDENNTSFYNKLKIQWNWIYDEWENIKGEEDIIKELSSKNIQCKNEIINNLNKSFVSKEYYEDEIESLVNELKIENVNFISEELISENRSKEKWLKIFKKLKAGINLQDFIKDIIEKLSSIEDEEKHFKIAKEIFKYWNGKIKDDNNLEPYLESLRSNLKIKTEASEYLIPSEVIISDHYQTGTPFNDILPSIIFYDSISADYDKKGSNNNWFNFFKEILNCPFVDQTQDVFDVKIDYYLQNQKYDNFREKHYNILSEIAKLFFSKRDNKIDFKNVDFTKVELECHTNEWRNAKKIHLSSLFCKEDDMDLQKDEIEEGVYFLSKKYTKSNFSRGFFKMCGVKNTFSYEVNDYPYKDCPDTRLAQRLKNATEFKSKYLQLRQRYSEEQILRYTTICNYVSIDYLQIINKGKYVEQFTNFIKNNIQKKELFVKTFLRNYSKTYSKEDNNLIKYLKSNEIVKSIKGDYKKSTELFSNRFKVYLEDSQVATDDWINVQVEYTGITLESAIGIQQSISQEIALDFISNSESKLTREDVEFLNLIEILESTELEDGILYYLPNRNYVWKPVIELFKVDEELGDEIKDSNKLHQSFENLTDKFSIRNLSENNLERRSEKENDVSESINKFLINRAKYIAFKANNENWNEIEDNIKGKFEELSFLECSKIKYVFPYDPPIEVKEINFDIDDKSLYFKGFWKNNSKLITYLYNLIKSETLPKAWFENLIVRWEESEIIDKLKDDFGETPSVWNAGNKDNETDVVDNQSIKITKDEEVFLKNIIGEDFEVDSQIDANLTAKIKALLEMRTRYSMNEISDEGSFISAGSDQVFVRSAQNGILFLDLYHWDKLSERVAYLYLYTNSQIKIFASQEELIEFTKPLNNFAVLRFPREYDILDYNSLNNIHDRGSWHFVFIVNDKTKAAKSYMATDLDKYNF